jgi:hypothetical protein
MFPIKKVWPMIGIDVIGGHVLKEKDHLKQVDSHIQFGNVLSKLTYEAVFCYRTVLTIYILGIMMIPLKKCEITPQTAAFPS